MLKKPHLQLRLPPQCLVDGRQLDVHVSNEGLLLSLQQGEQQRRWRQHSERER